MTRLLLILALAIIPANTLALTEDEVKALCKDGCVLLSRAQWEALEAILRDTKDCKRT